MSTVWGTRFRLLLEDVERQAQQLGRRQPCDAAAREEQVVRLLTGVLRMLRLHAVDPRGRCRSCDFSARTWQIRHRRRHCAVYRAVDFALTQPMDRVWWQLAQDTGRDADLGAIQNWMRGRDAAERDGGEV